MIEKKKREKAEFWTENAISRTVELWDEGYSATKIAERLLEEGLRKNCNRNIVMGQLSRQMKLGNRTRSENPKYKVTQLVKANIKRKQETKKETEVLRRQGSNHKALINLHPHQCRWPIGDPLANNFRFCSVILPTLQPIQYCAEHYSLSYVRPRTNFK